MTDFIYRTVAHTGTKPAAHGGAAALRYRGIAHDGGTVPMPVSAGPAQMIYRGVAYVSGLALAAQGPAAQGPGLAAPAPAARAEARPLAA